MNVESIAKFKTELGKQNDIRQVPKHYEIGLRKLNIALTQFNGTSKYWKTSNDSSSLKYDLVFSFVTQTLACKYRRRYW
jgi:hypothetical protein